MSLPRIKIRTRILESENDFHKRYASCGVSIGYRGNKMHIDGKGRERVTVTALSYYQEVGDPIRNRPPRPFILQALRGVNGVERIQRYMRRKNRTLKGLQNLVNKIVEECKQYVKSGMVNPGLKESTIKNKVANETIPTVETEMLIDDLEGWVHGWKGK